MRLSILLPLIAALSSAALTPARGADRPWRDIESRIQYGYYTEDVRSLTNLEPALAADESHDKLQAYYAGLLAWRLALLASAGSGAPRESAGRLADRCVSSLDAALAMQSDFAEGLALRAACRLAPSLAMHARAPLAAYRARKEMSEALRLAPANPRVLLLDAIGDYQLPPALGGNKERALVKLRQAVGAFESERAGADRLPGWGAAEAYLFLARDLLDHGDAVAARDALEHALLIAPQFAQARRLMAKITSG